MGTTTWVPKDLSEADHAFPARVTGVLLPTRDEIPEVFRREHSPWSRLVSEWFFRGLPDATVFTPKDGIDTGKALRHLSACLRSFEPKHEHKTAGVAWLLSLWFSSVTLPDGTRYADEAAPAT